jgi:hypothetical protein
VSVGSYWRQTRRIVSTPDTSILRTKANSEPVCNPFGGLGLTGGIVDIGGLYDCLAGIYHGKADPSILDKYSEIRRQKYSEIINPVSSENIVRLFGQDPDLALENDEFLKMCKRTANDLEFSRAFQSRVNMLRYDFMQHYQDAEIVSTSPIGEKINGIPLRQQVAVAGVID